MFCLQPTDFEKIDIDETHRGKKCLLCGKVKILEKAKAEFRTVNGVTYRLEEDELWHETYIENNLKGMLIASNENVLYD